MKTNVLILQSGGCTPVMNRSLFGVFDEALKHPVFDKIYGAYHGIDGVLQEDFIDLRRQSDVLWNIVAQTPAAALGSTRSKIKDEDITKILRVFAQHQIRFLFIIGGNDSAGTGHTLYLAAEANGYGLTVINVPKTIDNDLILTDHSPGYGSAARFVILATMGAGQDAKSMGHASPVTIIEIMGRDTGWLAASAALAKNDEYDPPHIICVPEVPLNEDHFLTRVERAYLQFGFVVAIVAENTRGINGVLGEQKEPYFVDDFGHAYFDAPGQYLAKLITEKLKVRARYEKPGTIQRTMETCISPSDSKEAELVGRSAIKYALAGHTDQIITLIRESGNQYTCNTGLASLGEVANSIKPIPSNYLDNENAFVTRKFIDYALPLIGNPLPKFGDFKQ